jgi:hypothetical protein
VTKTYQRKYSFIPQAVSRVLIFFISGLIHFPPAVQDLVIQVGSNSGLGYVVLLMLRLYVISPLLPLVPIVALGIVIHFLILSNKNSALLERRRLDAATEPEATSNTDTSLPTPAPPDDINLIPVDSRVDPIPSSSPPLSSVPSSLSSVLSSSLNDSDEERDAISDEDISSSSSSQSSRHHRFSVDSSGDECHSGNEEEEAEEEEEEEERA